MVSTLKTKTARLSVMSNVEERLEIELGDIRVIIHPEPKS
jgi:hypothetical protein